MHVGPAKPSQVEVRPVRKILQLRKSTSMAKTVRKMEKKAKASLHRLRKAVCHANKVLKQHGKAPPTATKQKKTKKSGKRAS